MSECRSHTDHVPECMGRGEGTQLRTRNSLGLTLRKGEAEIAPCSERLPGLARSARCVWGLRLMAVGEEVPGPHPPGLVSGWDGRSRGCAHGGQGQTGAAGWAGRAVHAGMEEAGGAGFAEPAGLPRCRSSAWDSRSSAFSGPSESNPVPPGDSILLTSRTFYVIVACPPHLRPRPKSPCKS